MSPSDYREYVRTNRSKLQNYEMREPYNSPNWMPAPPEGGYYPVSVLKNRLNWDRTGYPRDMRAEIPALANDAPTVYSNGYTRNHPWFSPRGKGKGMSGMGRDVSALPLRDPPSPPQNPYDVPIPARMRMPGLPPGSPMPPGPPTPPDAAAGASGGGGFPLAMAPALLSMGSGPARNPNPNAPHGMALLRQIIAASAKRNAQPGMVSVGPGMKLDAQTAAFLDAPEPLTSVGPGMRADARTARSRPPSSPMVSAGPGMQVDPQTAAGLGGGGIPLAAVPGTLAMQSVNSKERQPGPMPGPVPSTSVNATGPGFIGPPNTPGPQLPPPPQMGPPMPRFGVDVPIDPVAPLPSSVFGERTHLAPHPEPGQNPQIREVGNAYLGPLAFAKMLGDVGQPKPSPAGPGVPLPVQLPALMAAGGAMSPTPKAPPPGPGAISPEEPPMQIPGPSMYEVSRGDTLYGVADALMPGGSHEQKMALVQRIAGQNEIADPNRIDVGQVLALEGPLAQAPRKGQIVGKPKKKAAPPSRSKSGSNAPARSHPKRSTLAP